MQFNYAGEIKTEDHFILKRKSRSESIYFTANAIDLRLMQGQAKKEDKETDARNGGALNRRSKQRNYENPADIKPETWIQRQATAKQLKRGTKRGDSTGKRKERRHLWSSGSPGNLQRLILSLIAALLRPLVMGVTDDTRRENRPRIQESV